MADEASEVEARRRESKEMLAVALKDDQLWSAIRRVYDDALVGDFQFSGNVHVSFCDLVFSLSELRGELWSWAKEERAPTGSGKHPDRAPAREPGQRPAPTFAPTTPRTLMRAAEAARRLFSA
jgi:hypothetical protein